MIEEETQLEFEVRREKYFQEWVRMVEARRLIKRIFRNYYRS